jgi:hypothetical protein
VGVSIHGCQFSVTDLNVKEDIQFSLGECCASVFDGLTSALNLLVKRIIVRPDEAVTDAVRGSVERLAGANSAVNLSQHLR